MIDILELLKRAKAAQEAMSPEEWAAMVEAQRQSWLRGMAPCEHGVADWEDCPDCRKPLTNQGSEE